MDSVESVLGVDQVAQRASNGDKSRAASSTKPKRDGMAWAAVTITSEHLINPLVKCKHCPKSFKGGATRIVLHIINDCPGNTAEFRALKAEFLAEHNRSQNKKKKANAERLVDDADEQHENKAKIRRQKGQLSIEHSLQSALDADLDNSIAEMVYGLNLSANIVASPLFLKVVNKLKTAPPSYKPPTRARMLDDLLNKTTVALKNEQEPLRQSLLKDGGTVISDGWSDVSQNHLINFLIGTAKGMMFVGTTELKSTDSEDAKGIANLIGNEIVKAGSLSVVQVCTDTCSVMKAAWKIIEERFPWITCTCCGPHVMSLYLKDLGKITAIDSVISKVSQVLKQFCGKTRWARARLKEVTKEKHGKSLGLFRAKETRFAGKVTEMYSMKKLKKDLQQIVISEEYEAHHEQGSESIETVRTILLDEKGFWAQMDQALEIMTPVVCLLRLMDGTAPVMGKIISHLAAIEMKIKKSSVSWRDEALEIHKYRTKYLLSPMHEAGYALDPEFLEMEMTENIQAGLIMVTEKICLRDVMRERQETTINNARNEVREEAPALTIDSPSVQARVAATMMELSKYQARDGKFSKAFVIQNAKTMAPAAWWAMYGSHLSLLAAVARCVLAQPVCASAAERNWSIYGQIKRSNRTRLGHPVADKLVFCHEAIHLRSKLQSASSTPESVPWRETDAVVIVDDTADDSSSNGDGSTPAHG